VHNFYASCMSLGFVESDKEKPLLKVINALGGWEVLRSFNIYSWDAHRVLQRLHADYFVHAFFRVYVEADAYATAPGKNIIHIMPDGLGMPHRDYYLNRMPDDPAVKAYQTFLKDSAQLFGAASTEAHKFSIDMFNFEKRLAEITPDFEYLADPLKTVNRMTFKDLHAMSMNIPWLEIAKAAYTEAPLAEDTEVVVISPQYAADIAVILSTTDRGSLNNYLMWQLARAYMPYLSKPFRESVDLYRKALTGASKPPERWEFCAHTTERFFSHLTSSMVAQKRPRAEDGERHRVAKKLFDYLKHNVARSISVSAAYDYPSRRAAIGKLKNMTVQVGTPDFLRDRKYLKFMFKDLLVQKTDFFQNILYGVIFLRKRQELALVSPSEETRWMEALNKEDSVTYVTSANRVVVPEVFLQTPLFHPGFPNSVNLGGVGIWMAKAMLEGVIGRGLLFEANGRLRPHNSTLFGSDNAAFHDPRPILEMDAKCLVDKYSVAGLDTVEQLLKCRMDSVMTVAAVWQAFITLEDILELERGILLPAMESMDPQAVFFLAYGQTMCSTATERASDIQRTAYNRLANKANLLGSLSQVSKFHQFYSCPFDEEQSCGQII
jgi:predicted metalloendopeptidase